MVNVATDILQGLNEEQREAVETVEGALLIIAGPGSGKTRAITHRIAYLVRVCGVSPRRILAVTFTNKAAREMLERLQGLLGSVARDLTVGTFHSLGVRILRAHGEALGIDKNFVIYDQEDQLSLVRRCLEELGLDPKQYTPRAVLAGISAAKAQMFTLEEHAARRTHYFEEIVHRVYERYENYLHQSKALDFDDLLFRSVLLFQKHPDVLQGYQERYLHVLVDEFQDTNLCQYLLMRQIAGGHGNICVVGDPDQSIYSWRYADLRNILNFEKDYPHAKVVVLGRNYRSTQNILDAAHALISANRERKEKSLWTDQGAGEPIAAMETGSEQEEALAVVGEIARLEREGQARPGDCAVMYRTNAQSRTLEEAFNRYGIPYRLIGGLRFWERREVKDVVAYLKVVQNPFDSVSLGRIINVPARSIGQRTVEEVTRWAGRHGVPLYTALQVATDGGEESDREIAGPRLQPRARGALRGLLTLLHDLMELGQRVQVTRLVDQVVERTGYRKALLEEEDGEERWENVQELKTVATQFQDLAGQEGLVAFLESAALASDIDRIEDGVGAATLITLHQAKGLEFPVVFLVGLEEGLLPHRRSYDDPAQMEEERRICYVGMTRAKERLYLLRAARRSFMGSRMVNPPSRFLADIPAQATTTMGGAAERRWGRSPIRPPAVDLRAGDHVRHVTFGEGIVIGVLPQEADAQVTVAFKGEAGVKRLLYSYAKLEKVP